MSDRTEATPSGPDNGHGAPAESTLPQAADPPKDKGEPPEAPPPRARWPWIVAAVVIVAFVAMVLFLIFRPRTTERTDDAFVSAHSAVVSPRVNGQVDAVLVDDNQPVERGQLLLTLDGRDYAAALRQAEGVLAGDRAQVQQADVQVRRQPALVEQARARLRSAEARAALSRVNALRYAHLASTGSGSVQQGQETETTLRQDEAAVVAARADLTSVSQQVDALAADTRAATARVASDRAAVTQARLNLGYTRLYAPIRGTVNQRQVQVGDHLNVGSPAMTVVPLDDVYVDANYREVALRHMAPGQRARIHVDAYDIWLNGVVQSLGAASGASFSPIPPNNATGNFTKIVQRLPVRIRILPGQPLARLLRVGMSVETDVDTGLSNIVAAQRGTDHRVTAP